MRLPLVSCSHESCRAAVYAMPAAVQVHDGQNTLTSSDFMLPGETLISCLISPRVTASAA
jgi:hypothetical protein